MHFLNELNTKGLQFRYMNLRLSPYFGLRLTRKPVEYGTFVRFSLGGKINGKLHLTLQLSAVERKQAGI